MIFFDMLYLRLVVRFIEYKIIIVYNYKLDECVLYSLEILFLLNSLEILSV